MEIEDVKILIEKLVKNNGKMRCDGCEMIFKDERGWWFMDGVVVCSSECFHEATNNKYQLTDFEKTPTGRIKTFYDGEERRPITKTIINESALKDKPLYGLDTNTLIVLWEKILEIEDETNVVLI